MASTSPPVADEVAASVAVVTVAPTTLADTDLCIDWSRRSTDKTPVIAANRFRGVVIPKSQLLVPHNACSSPFYALLQETILQLARDVFRTWVQDNMLATTMETARLSLDRVLAFWAEEIERTKMSAESIIDFLKESATLRDFTESKRKTWLHRIPKIAAPAYRGSIDQEDAAAIIAQLHDDDLQHPAAIYIVQRCNNILIGAAAVKEAL